MTRNMSALALPPLPIFFLPALPPISDPALARTVITHSSTHAAQRDAQSLSTTEGTRPDDYEKLEHVGDGVLGHVVTGLLHDLFPQLPPGTATMLKAHLVNNDTLAQLCTRYGIIDGLIASPAALYTARMQTKVQASVFEAYIAGVYYDYLTSERPGVYEDNDNDSIAVTVDTADAEMMAEGSIRAVSVSEPNGEEDGDDTVDAIEIGNGEKTPPGTAPSRAPSRCSVAPVESLYQPLPADVSVPTLRPVHLRTRGEAFDYLEAWLRPLFVPVAHFALEFMREKVREGQEIVPGGTDDEPAHDAHAAGAAGALNSWAQHDHRKLPAYSYTSAGDGLWQCMCHLEISDDGDAKTYEASAKRDTKKGAMAIAAWKVARQLGLKVGK